MKALLADLHPPKDPAQVLDLPYRRFSIGESSNRPAGATHPRRAAAGILLGLLLVLSRSIPAAVRPAVPPVDRLEAEQFANFGGWVVDQPFIGMDPNGLWTPYPADLSQIGESTLAGWGLVVDVPEPGSAGLIVMGLTGGRLWVWRRKQTGGQADRRRLTVGVREQG